MTTSPPCDCDPVDPGAAHEAYLRDQARQVVRSGVLADWATWSREQTVCYLAECLAEDEGLDAASAGDAALDDVAAFLRCLQDEAREWREEEEELARFHGEGWADPFEVDPGDQAHEDTWANAAEEE